VCAHLGNELCRARLRAKLVVKKKRALRVRWVVRWQSAKKTGRQEAAKEAVAQAAALVGLLLVRKPTIF
jgi:hypothetical protein